MWFRNDVTTSHKEAPPLVNATRTRLTVAAIISVMFLSIAALAQQTSEIRPTPVKATVVSNAAAPRAAGAPSESTERERILVDRIEKLERRLAELESRSESKVIRETFQPALTSG